MSAQTIPAAGSDMHRAWRPSSYPYDPAMIPEMIYGVFATAARLMSTRGYHPHAGIDQVLFGDGPTGGDSPYTGPLSLAGAVYVAARIMRPGDEAAAADLEENAQVHLAGILYATGQRRTRTVGMAGDIADIPYMWDGDHGHAIGAQQPGRSVPVVILETAAAFMLLMSPAGDGD